MRYLLKLVLMGLGISLLLTSLLLAFARRHPAVGSSWIAYASGEMQGVVDIYRMSPTGIGHVRLLHDVGVVRRISFAPDGRSFVFDGVLGGTLPGSVAAHQIYRYDLDTRRLTQLTDDNLLAQAPAWSPDGAWIAYVATHEVPVTRLNNVPLDSDHYVFRMRPDGSDVVSLATTVQMGRVQWSPDGQWLTYVGLLGQNPDVFKMSVDGSRRQRLTTAEAYDLSPFWSPDGHQIAFLSNRYSSYPNQYSLFVMNADGTDQRNILMAPRFQGAPAWSPDGAWLALVDNRLGLHHIYRVRPDGTKLQRLTPDNGRESWAPAWSPPIDLPWRGERLFLLAAMLVAGTMWLIPRL